VARRFTSWFPADLRRNSCEMRRREPVGVCICGLVVSPRGLRDCGLRMMNRRLRGRVDTRQHEKIKIATNPRPAPESSPKALRTGRADCCTLLTCVL